MKTNQIVIFDLDDTLYYEIDYLKSAFQEISSWLEKEYSIIGVYDFMMKAFSEKKNVFQFINELFSLSVPLEKYLIVYRNHIPNIKLDYDTIEILSYLKNNSVAMGLITDGRTITQKNKIQALGLFNFFSEDCVIISEEFGTEKPNEKNFKYFQDKFGSGHYYYVGDNIKKDFLTPNKLNWASICLLNKGNNINEQHFNFSSEYLPKYKINSISEIKSIIAK